jgi:hypothetical protein
MSVASRPPKCCDTCYPKGPLGRPDPLRARITASLPNLAIGALRLAGRTNVTEAIRWACRNMTRPFTPFGPT